MATVDRISKFSQLTVRNKFLSFNFFLAIQCWCFKTFYLLCHHDGVRQRHVDQYSAEQQTAIMRKLSFWQNFTGNFELFKMVQFPRFDWFWLDSVDWSWLCNFGLLYTFYRDEFGTFFIRDTNQFIPFNYTIWWMQRLTLSISSDYSSITNGISISMGYLNGSASPKYAMQCDSFNNFVEIQSNTHIVFYVCNTQSRMHSLIQLQIHSYTRSFIHSSS